MELDKSEAKVLFIDDEMKILSMLQLIYSDIWDVYCANNRRETFEILEKYDISIVIADYLMPEIDGISLLKEIGARYPDIPKLLFSGNIKQKGVSLALDDGIFKHAISKPIEGEKFIEIVNMEIQKFRLQQSTKEERFVLDSILNSSGYETIGEQLFKDLNLLGSLSRTELQEKLVDITQELSGLVFLHLKLIFSKNDVSKIRSVYHYLNDLMILSRQYKQSILFVMAGISKSYLLLVVGKVQQAKEMYQKVLSNMTSIIEMDDTIVDAINNFQNYILLINENRIMSKIQNILLDMFQLDTRKIIWINETYQTTVNLPLSPKLLIVVRNGIKVYHRKAPEFSFDTNKVVDFVSSFSSFQADVTHDQSEMEVIELRNIVIYYLHLKDTKYVLLADNVELRHRFAMWQFAQQSIDYVQAIKQGYQISGEDKKTCDELAYHLFHFGN